MKLYFHRGANLVVLTPGKQAKTKMNETHALTLTPKERGNQQTSL